MLNRLAHWLLVEPKHFWLCIGVCLLSFVVVLWAGTGERAIRLIGLALQLLGILTVVWGIVQTRHFFDMPSPAKALVDWLARFPLRGIPPITGIAAATLGGAALAARGHTSWPDDPSLPIEERVLRMAKNVPLLHERITNFQSQVDFAVADLTAAIEREASVRAHVAKHLSSRIKEHSTGGLHISAIGAVWLFLGSIFGTAAQELTTWLK